MMTLDERRSGLILDDHPLWLEALEPLPVSYTHLTLPTTPYV